MADPVPIYAYCSIAQLHALGLNSDALSQFTNDEKDFAVSTASRMMDGYLRNRMTLPLVENESTPGETGADLAECAAVLASMTLLSSRGYNPRDPGQEVPLIRWEQKNRWLKDIAQGLVTPDCTDSSADPGGEGRPSDRPEITTNRSRGWESRNNINPSPAFTGRKRDPGDPWV